MNCLNKYLVPFVAGAIVVSLSSCNSSPTRSTSDSSAVPPAATPSSPSTALSDSLTPTPASPVEETPVATPSTAASQKTPTETSSASSSSTQKTPIARQSSNTKATQATSTAQSNKTVSLKIYRADSQCQNLLPATAAFPSANPVNAAVGKVIEEANSSDFELAGYRVNVDKNGVATVDLRRSPNSQRQFASLSACEQFALFASLRKTLTDNTQLKIKDVRFTEQGQEIAL